MTAPALDSRVSFVTVYRSGARVVRVAEITRDGTEYPASVRVGGLPLCLDDGSVRARVLPLVDGDPVPVAADLRVVLEIPDEDQSLPDADDADVRALGQDIVRRQAAINQLERELARLTAVNTPRRPDGAEGQPPIDSPTRARLGMTRFLMERAAALNTELIAARKDLDAAMRRLDRAREVDRKRTGARQARSHELRKTVLIGLAERQSGESARIELEYAVPGARWAPAYSVRFAADMSRASLSMRAVVAQHTGENWSGVGLTLSTAEPASWTELPELASVRIGRRQPAAPKAGWRPPPAGAEALYADYDRAFESLAAPAPKAPYGVPVVAGSASGGSAATEILASLRAEEAAAAYAAAEDEEMFGELAEPEPIDALVDDDMDDARRRPAMEFAPPPPAAYAPAPVQSMPVASKSRGLFSFGGRARSAAPPPQQRKAKKKMVLGGAAPGGVPLDAPAEPPAPRELRAREDLLGYGNLRMGGAHHARRGELAPASPVEQYMQLLVATKVEVTVDVIAVIAAARRLAENVSSIGLPDGHNAQWTGHYDYAYVAEHPVDVPSGDGFHSIPIEVRDTTSELLYIAVPRESSDVFRTAKVTNPLASPLLAGPVDVYVGDAFLLTSELEFTAPSSGFSLGLGVEQGIKLARNTRFREETSGLLGGSLELHHHIDVEIQNRLDRPVDMEVRDRVPVTQKDEEDVKVVVKSASPPWEAYEPFASERGTKKLRGGYRWRTTVAPGDKQDLRAAYTVELSSKLELIGGNRRED